MRALVSGIEVDYHMMDYYGSAEYAAVERARPKPSASERAEAAGVMAAFLWTWSTLRAAAARGVQAHPAAGQAAGDRGPAVHAVPVAWVACVAG